MATKIVRVRYSVQFNATIEVPDDATPKQIGEELANLKIPEDQNSIYCEDTFEPVVNDDGDPVLFDENGDPIG